MVCCLIGYKLRFHSVLPSISKTALVIICILTILPKSSLLVYQIQDSWRDIWRQSNILFIEVKGASLGTGILILTPFSGGVIQRLIWIIGMASHYFLEEVFSFLQKASMSAKGPCCGGPNKRKNKQGHMLQLHIQWPIP